MERIVVAIVNHLKNTVCSVMCQQQHEFTSARSTVTNLFEATDIWTEVLSLSHNIPVEVILLDYAKAFDTVPH